jgi:general stress protein YciG
VTRIDKKNPAAVLGQKGGKKRAENLSPEDLREIGRKGAAARWGAKKKAATKKGTK